MENKLNDLNKNFWKLEDFQELIDNKKYKIEKPTDLLRFNKLLYNRAQYLGYLSKLSYRNRRRESGLYTNYTMSDIQKEIEDNCIISKTELKSTNQSLYNRYKFLKKRTNEDLVFKKAGLNSFEEKKFLIFLIENNIKNFSTQFEICNIKKNHRACRYDFYLIDYNCIIEVHGSQHFNNDCMNFISQRKEDVEDIQLNDEYKFEAAKLAGIKLYYFTYSKKLYEKFGYFEKVYTDPEELLVTITGKELTKNVNFKEDIKEYFCTKQQNSILINTAQKFIDENNITTKENLRLLNSGIYYRLKRESLLNNVIFKKKDPLKLIDTRYMNSPQDINIAMRENGINTYKELKDKCYGLSQKIDKFNWRTKLEFKISENLYKSAENITLFEINNYLIKYYKIRSTRQLCYEHRDIFNKAKENNWLSQLKYYSEKDENLKDGEDE